MEANRKEEAFIAHLSSVRGDGDRQENSNSSITSASRHGLETKRFLKKLIVPKYSHTTQVHCSKYYCTFRAIVPSTLVYPRVFFLSTVVHLSSSIPSIIYQSKSILS